MALAVFRSCVMSRITVGVTRKLKATCQKKPDCNKIRDRDLCPLIPTPRGVPVPPGEGLDWDSIDLELYASLYESEPYPDDVDDEERKLLVLSLMFALKEADETSDFDLRLCRHPISEHPIYRFLPIDARPHGFYYEYESTRPGDD